jgi:nicotinamidase/pyrazinamidase
VAGSPGAAFPESLVLPASTTIISKGCDPNLDAYSGFQGTDLDRRLRTRGIHRVLIGGLATDYCVLETVNDALANGYEVELLEDAMRAVDVHSNDGERAKEEMLRRGAMAIRFDMVG